MSPVVTDADIANVLAQAWTRLESWLTGHYPLSTRVVATSASGNNYDITIETGETEEFPYEDRSVSSVYRIRPGRVIRNGGETIDGYVGICALSRTLLVLDKNREPITRSSSLVVFRYVN